MLQRVIQAEARVTVEEIAWLVPVEIPDDNIAGWFEHAICVEGSGVNLEDHLTESTKKAILEEVNRWIQDRGWECE